MAIQLISGEGFWIPGLPPTFGATSGAGIYGPIDATGEKLAHIGRVWWPGTASSKTITGVGFRFGNSITKAGGSALTVSLQDVDLATGPPYQPDGTQDQTAAVANANASFAANTWIDLTFGSTRAVNKGDRLAVVIEFDGSGRLGADSVNFAALASSNSGAYGGAGISHFTASWAATTGSPGVIFAFDDGTYGKFAGSWPSNTATSATVTANTGTTPDEVGLKFSLPFSVSVDQLAAYLSVSASSSDFDVILYDSGGSVVASGSADANATNATGTARVFLIPIVPTTLSANTTYRLVVKPTTANSVVVMHVDVATANHLTVHPGGTAWHWTQRTDGGAWTDTTTRRPYYFGLQVAGVDSGTAGGYSRGRVVN